MSCDGYREGNYGTFATATGTLPLCLRERTGAETPMTRRV